MWSLGVLSTEYRVLSTQYKAEGRIYGDSGGIPKLDDGREAAAGHQCIAHIRARKERIRARKEKDWKWDMG